MRSILRLVSTLGFALQPVRLCLHLLTCDAGSTVSLEHLDDVAIHTANGEITLEQTKSALTQNPLSDWAADFWKTIGYWIASGAADTPTTRFRYYVTPIKPRARTQALSNASTKEEVVAITAEIRTALKRFKNPPACMPDLKLYLDATDDQRAALITRFEVVCVDDDPVAPLRKCFGVGVEPSILDDVCHAAIGFAKEEADSLIRNGKPAIIHADKFRLKVGAYVRKVNLPGLLTSFTPKPPPGVVAGVFLTRPTFIRQLEIIDATSDERLRAVSDFLRASADKSRWAERGLTFEESLDEWDDDLIRRHSAISGEIEDLHSHQPAELCGRLAYRRCSVLEPPLEGRAVPGHFVHGCFNSLADLQRLGWHPEYASLLKQGT